MGNSKLAESTVRELGDGLETPSLRHVSSLDSQDTQAPGEAIDISTQLKVSKARGVTMIVTLSGISFLNTMGSGILIAALPRIADDVGLEKNLILVSLFLVSSYPGTLLHATR